MLVAFGCLVCGCGHDVAVTDGGLADLTSAEDASDGSPLCPSTRTYNDNDLGAPLECTSDGGPPSVTMEPAEITEISLVDDPAFVRVGVALRVRVGYLARACDLPGGPSIGFPSSNVFLVSATRLHREGCDGPMRVVHSTSDIEYFAPNYAKEPGLLILQTSTGSPSLAIQIPPLFPGDDIKAAGPGEPCHYSDDCLFGCPGGYIYQCVPTSPTGGVCALECDDDTDCYYDEQAQCATWKGASSVCAPARGDSCTSDADCRFGARCTTIGEAHVCRTAQWRGPQPDDCTCDGECGFGNLCLPIAGTNCQDSTQHCATPCSQWLDCSDPYPTCINGFCNCISD